MLVSRRFWIAALLLCFGCLGASEQQTASIVLDVDRDGLQDFVIAARRKAPALVLYRRDAAGWDCRRDRAAAGT